MGKQEGPIRIEGTLGGIIFYKNKHGYLTRLKGGISKQRIANDRNFAATRQNATEFGYASRTGKLLRQGIKACCPGAESGDTNFMLAARMVKVVREDKIHARGSKRLTPDNAHVLEGFEWQEAAKLSEMLIPAVTLEIDPAGGTAACRIPEFLAARDCRMPDGASHVQLTLAVVRVDDVAGAQISAHTSYEALLSQDGQATELFIQCPLPEGKGTILMAGLGIAGLQESNGMMLRMMGKCGFRVGKVVVMEL